MWFGIIISLAIMILPAIGIPIVKAKNLKISADYSIDYFIVRPLRFVFVTILVFSICISVFLIILFIFLVIENLVFYFLSLPFASIIFLLFKITYGSYNYKIIGTKKHLKFYGFWRTKEKIILYKDIDYVLLTILENGLVKSEVCRFYSKEHKKLFKVIDSYSCYDFLKGALKINKIKIRYN